MYDLQPALCGCCTQHELQGMKEKDRKQPWLPAKTSWENILHNPITPPFLLLSPLLCPSPPQQLWDREGRSSCSPKGEREDGNAREMGVVLNGMKLTALHPAKREYDPQQRDKAYFPSVTVQCLNVVLVTVLYIYYLKLIRFCRNTGQKEIRHTCRYELLMSDNDP